MSPSKGGDETYRRKSREMMDRLDFKGHEVFEFTGPGEYSQAELTAALGRAIGKPNLKCPVSL